MSTIVERCNRNNPSWRIENIVVWKCVSSSHPQSNFLWKECSFQCSDNMKRQWKRRLYSITASTKHHRHLLHGLPTLLLITSIQAEFYQAMKPKKRILTIWPVFSENEYLFRKCMYDVFAFIIRCWFSVLTCEQLSTLSRCIILLLTYHFPFI